MTLLACNMAHFCVFKPHMVSESVFPAKGLSAVGIQAPVPLRGDVRSLDMANQATLVGVRALRGTIFPLAL